MAAAEGPPNRPGRLGISAARSRALLVVAGFSCCMAMSMPQVHLVAYCGDLGYGVAIGAQILSLMLGTRRRQPRSPPASLPTDRRTGPMLILGSAMQATALLLYMFFDSLTSLFVISGLFGLFQGGIVPMYAVIIREFLPPREAGARSASSSWRRCSAWRPAASPPASSTTRRAPTGSPSCTASCGTAINLAIVCWLILRPRRRQAKQRQAGPA